MGIESDIKNFYESLVVEEIYKLSDDGKIEEQDMEDIACVALNNLPSKYYRHSVDMAFYLAGEEQKEIYKRVTEETEKAISFVKKHRKL